MCYIYKSTNDQGYLFSPEVVPYFLCELGKTRYRRRDVMEMALKSATDTLAKAQRLVGSFSPTVELDGSKVVVYGDIHGEPTAAYEALKTAQAGKQVVVLGDLGWRAQSWPNEQGQILETIMVLLQAMTEHNAVLLRGNCDNWQALTSLIISDVYPDVATQWCMQTYIAEKLCKVMERLPVVATTPTAMMVHGCVTESMQPDEVMWSVFNPEVTDDREYERFGPPSLEVGWPTVKETLGARSTLLIGHQKKPGVKEQGFQVDRDGDHQVACLMSSSQDGAVGRPVKCILSADNIDFVPLG